MTSEERREVAEDLRHLTIGHYVQYKEQFFDELAEVVVGFEDYHDFDVVLEKLADLIDPTCHMTCRGSFTAHHDFTRWECGECGAYAFAPGKWNAPRFCPHCGTRFVNDGEVGKDD